ncbi:MAG: molybdopterin-dependent oxidoreductase [Chlorobiaceae bacterium]|nr:molybdopterin-dependent oxidoreductase [Chlorobiaceae bacterium]
MKSMKAKIVSGKSLCMLLIAMLFTTGSVSAKKTENVSTMVTVSGLVEKPFTITTESIRTMHPVERENSSIVCDSGQTRKVLKSYKGVLLRDVLDSAKVVMPNSKQRREYAVLVRSTDDYNVLFTYNELFYGTAGDNTWLIFEENGKAIRDNGLFVLFCSNDKFTGPRHVKFVNGLEVLKVDAGRKVPTNCSQPSMK